MELARGLIYLLVFFEVFAVELIESSRRVIPVLLHCCDEVNSLLYAAARPRKNYATEYNRATTSETVGLLCTK